MADKKLAALEEEIKLLKGEVKQSLASVRDHLLNMELPSSEISTILAALGSDGEQPVTMKGSFEMPPEKAVSDVARDGDESFVQNEDEAEPYVPPDDDMFGTGEIVTEETDSDELDTVGGGTGAGVGAGEATIDEDDLSPEDDADDLLAEEETLEDEEVLEEPAETLEDVYEEPAPEDGPEEDEGEPEAMDSYPVVATEAASAIPKVNMMANLINWIARAKQEIGYDQLPVFLEVYGISGYLSPEMKDVILHLAEMSEETPPAPTSAVIWSEQMLSLHGILTGGETPLHPVIPSWSNGEDISEQLTEEEIMPEPHDETPVKLKLVFPGEDGENHEYTIDLSPDAEEPDPKKRKRS